MVSFYIRSKFPNELVKMGRVVQRADDAIQRINRYPADK